MTLRRKYRSSRKVPFSISCSRSLLVAAMTRTSTLIVRADPRRSTSPSCSTRSTFACVFALMSPTSSRKMVPRSACSNLPICFSVAPVNEPFSWPNSSDSISSSGNRGAVDLDEPVAAPQAVAMDRPRHQFLADAALAGEQHRRVRRRGALDRVPDLAQRRALAHHLVPDFRRPPQRPVLVRQPRALERVPDRDQQLFARRRLLDEVERAGLGRLDGSADGAVARDDHDRQIVVRGPQPLQHLETVHARHLDVKEHQIGRLALGQRDPFRSARRLEHVVIVVSQDHADRPAHFRLVIDDQICVLSSNALSWISRRSR